MHIVPPQNIGGNGRIVIDKGRNEIFFLHCLHYNDTCKVNQLFTEGECSWICYLSTLRNRILHVTTAKAKIKRNGKRLSNLKALSVISLYPHEAGNSFPIVPNAFGSSSIGNIIPESMVEGIKIMIENIEVFAWSFTAKPIILAILRDTPIKTARLIKYLPGFSGISA